MLQLDFICNVVKHDECSNDFFGGIVKGTQCHIDKLFLIPLVFHKQFINVGDILGNESLTVQRPQYGCENVVGKYILKLVSNHLPVIHAVYL